MMNSFSFERIRKAISRSARIPFYKSPTLRKPQWQFPLFLLYSEKWYYVTALA